MGKENKNITVTRVTGDKLQYAELLLLADESMEMIGRYLDRGEMYVLRDGGQTCTVAVVTDEGGGLCELKNLATRPDRQRCGYGRRMIEFLAEHLRGRFGEMTVGTGEVPGTLRFYRNCGFTPSHRVKDFFTDNYPAPIIEEGILLRDMVYLRRRLQPSRDTAKATVAENTEK